MSRYLGIDLGTTTIAAVVLDTDSAQVIARHSTPNDSRLSGNEKPPGRSEWDIDRMVELSLQVISTVTEHIEVNALAGLGVTGQMHGMVLLDAGAQPVSPFIGWQDQRCEEQISGDKTYLQQMLELAGDGFEHSGCTPATGYMGSTLFWLKHNDLLPADTTACFAPDYLVSRLCDSQPVTDSTNAASAGLFDVMAGAWNDELIVSLGLHATHLPSVQPSCQAVGNLTESAAARTGLPVGLPVTNGCGDNQASFAGSVADYERSVLVNIGTGAQISAFTEQPLLGQGLDLRPALGSSFLLVGATLCGGHSYQILRDFFCQAGRDIFGLADMPDIYDVLNQVASEVPPGADGLHCEPLFTGSRQQPEQRAIWRGMSETNFTPGHMARALLEGLAEQIRMLYERMQQAGLGDHDLLVGSGNAIRKNQLLADILSASFDLPLQMTTYTEEAAVGAALCAAVATDEFLDIHQASRAVVGTSRPN